MKLKLKLRNPNVSFNIQLEAEKQTFKHLKEEISQILNSQVFVFEGSIPFDVSLNGNDVINGTEETSLQSLGIVSGDLLHVMIESDVLKKLTPIENVSNRCEKAAKKMNVEGIEDEKIINRYLNEPMLCRESTEVSIPSSLRQAFKRSQVETVHDALTVVLNVLMTESGFVLQERLKTSGGVYNLVYCNRYADFSCKLVCIPMERILMVNGIVFGDGTETSKVLSKCELDCNNYIVTKLTYKDIDPIHVYKNLAQLSHYFKDNVVYPLQMFSQSGVQTGFLALPTEVKLLILTFLDVRELLSVSSVCSELNQIANEQTLWKKLFYRYFKNIVNETEIDWKQKYKEVYIQRNEAKRNRSRLIMDPHFGLHPLPLRNPFPWLPQPLGGDFDLYPPIFPGGHLSPPRPRIDPIVPGVPEPPLYRNRRTLRDPFGFFQHHMHFI